MRARGGTTGVSRIAANLFARGCLSGSPLSAARRSPLMNGGATITTNEWGMKMREGKLATIFCSALALVSGVAYAGSAPKELYGKSIAVTWTESITGKFGPDPVTRNVGRPYQMSIYISSAGRPFVRVIESGFGGSYSYSRRQPGPEIGNRSG